MHQMFQILIVEDVIPVSEESGGIFLRSPVSSEFRA